MHRHLSLLVVWFAGSVHLTWAVLLLIPGNKASGATPPHLLTRILGGNFSAACLLIGIVFLAFFGILAPIKAHTAVLCLIPQQIALAISAGGAFGAMYYSHYADGVIRPVTFIIADQMPMVVAFLAHTATLILLYVVGRKSV